MLKEKKSLKTPFPGEIEVEVDGVEMKAERSWRDLG